MQFLWGSQLTYNGGLVYNYLATFGLPSAWRAPFFVQTLQSSMLHARFPLSLRVTLFSFSRTNATHSLIPCGILFPDGRWVCIRTSSGLINLSSIVSLIDPEISTDDVLFTLLFSDPVSKLPVSELFVCMLFVTEASVSFLSSSRSFLLFPHFFVL